jgi:hypothetical protein
LTLSWRLAGVERALSTGALPFFIQWECPPDLHPGAANAEHRVQPTGVAWIEVAGDPSVLSDWLGATELPVRVDQGSEAITAVGIATAAGEFVLR